MYDSSGSEKSSSDEDEDEAFLLRELERIKEDRRLEEERKLTDESEIKKKAARALSSASTQGGIHADRTGVKRKWNDDVVFRVKEDRQSHAPNFVNDTVRNDFHRKFLKKYIK